MQERRHHRRFRLWLPARIDGGAEAGQLAVGHELSQGGALLVTDAELAVGKRVSLVLQLPPGEGEERALSATVVRSEPNADDPNGRWPFRAALQFDEPDPELEAELRKHSAVLEGMTDASEQET